MRVWHLMFHKIMQSYGLKTFLLALDVNNKHGHWCLRVSGR